MATKTVALDAEAYDLLKRQKRSDKSFSDAVKRLAKPSRPLSSFAGMWGELSAKERRALEATYAGIRDADRRRSDRVRESWGEK